MKAKKSGMIILGIGNILKADDGIGVHAINELRKLPLPEEVDVIEVGTGSFDILKLFDTADNFIIIDAIDCDAKPGTVFTLKPAEFSGFPENKISLHEFGLEEILNYLRKRKDIKAIIIGVQPKDTYSWSLELTKEVQEAVPRIVDMVLTEVKKYTARY